MDGAEQAVSIEDNRSSTGKFEIHMNTMGWSISKEHHKKWKIGVERLGASFKAPKEKYTPGKNPKNKYSTANTIALESRAVYLGTIFWKELKTRKKKPDKKNNLYLIVLIFFINCKSQNRDYKVIHFSNDEIQTIYYFHAINEEFARTYGNSFKSDSLTFTRKQNDLVVKEFSYEEKQKKRKPIGEIRYVNYYKTVSDIISTGNTFSINQVPIKDFNFYSKDNDLENLLKENCQKEIGLITYNKCDFVLPKDYEMMYFPNNSTIKSAQIIKENDVLKEVEIEAKYFDVNFKYKRKYVYQDKK